MMGKVNRFLQLFLNYGLVAAILVWAATVALMAYHLKESPWRWAFILLSLAGTRNDRRHFLDSEVRQSGYPKCSRKRGRHDESQNLCDAEAGYS